MVGCLPDVVGKYSLSTTVTRGKCHQDDEDDDDDVNDGGDGTTA